jgi:hypothetical protein
MLNADIFQNLMQPQIAANFMEHEYIRMVAQKIPWFADAQILLLKTLKEQEHSDFAEMLPKLSLYATNRKMLMEYLHSVATAAVAINLEDI